ncbi:MAG: nucleotidyltransferase family protein [Sphingomicrobium sp.]
MSAARVPTTAMVMAAGLGTRMRPLTDTRPKPLIEVAGKPLIDHVLDRLDAAGIEQAVVNVHYLADAMDAHLAGRRRGPHVIVSDERDLLLETGGGLVRAAPHLGDPFLSLNSDNLWTDGSGDTLVKLAEAWDGDTMDALLLLVPLERAGNHRGKGDFFLADDGRVRRRGEADSAPFVFSGIQICAKTLLRDAPDGPFSTNVLWTRAIAKGRCFGVIHDGRWFDVGNPEAIAATEAELVDG